MRPPASGALRFAAYAYPPNALGYCGPDAAQPLLAQGAWGGDDPGPRRPAADVDHCQVDVATTEPVACTFGGPGGGARWSGRLRSCTRCGAPGS